MSTITVTDLIPGDLATSADVNATITSWNTGTAALQMNGTNVAMEGIDRRTMAGINHVVATGELGDNTIVFSTTAAAVANATATYALLTLGGPTDMQTASATISSSHQGILHASVSFTSPTTLAASQAILYLILQRSTNGGGAWTDIAGTEQIFSTKGILLDSAAAGRPGVCSSASWSIGFTPPGGAVLFRIAFKTVVSTFTFGNGTIFFEVYGA